MADTDRLTEVAETLLYTLYFRALDQRSKARSSAISAYAAIDDQAPVIP